MGNFGQQKLAVGVGFTKRFFKPFFGKKEVICARTLKKPSNSMVETQPGVVFF
tara:strand:- start:1568 stop:1726 length:159 start_codon:yes stop_codon:yes gene_type:complete